MKNFYGPWYTLAEAQEKLAVNTSELRFLIEKKEIQCVVYTKSRQFLLFYIANDNRWVGVGTCSYQGHYSMHISFVKKLLDQQTFSIGLGYGRLLDVDGIQDFSAKYPFRKNVPHGVLSGWDENQLNSSEIQKLSATPLPNEQTPLTTSIKFITDSISAAQQGEHDPAAAMQELTNPENLKLFYDDNSKFSPESLRIPASEIDKIKSGIDSLKKINRPSDLPPSDGRENQLDTLIKKILLRHPNMKNLGIWKCIERDFASDVPEFDTENILECVDTQCIEWRSRYGNKQSLKWSSFASKVSKLRNQMNKPTSKAI